MYCYVVPGCRACRGFAGQKPLGPKMYRRIAVTAPQLLHRSVQRHEEFIRCIQMCFGYVRNIDTSLHHGRSEMIILGVMAAMHASNVLVSISSVMIGMNVHASTLIECQVWTVVSFWAACPERWGQIRILFAILGWYWLLFPPSSTESHLFRNFVP